jgi:hypothetical protein
VLYGSRGLLGAIAAAACGVVACGPSFQAVYECDVRFEHCYALDQKSVSVEAKKSCWREWLQGYTYGQSRDRVEYAGTRVSELSLDPTLPSEEGPHARPAHAHNVAAPVPTNAFAPPPNMVEHPADPPAPSASGGGAAHPSTHAPGEDCTAGCQEKWKSCHETCKAAACGGCDKIYRGCVPGCFR